uniref:Uncharacterized protein n=1 Tax=Junco hyemalis TaxID=40217 RepID=A0A8C5JQ07_JUNHY
LTCSSSFSATGQSDPSATGGLGVTSHSCSGPCRASSSPAPWAGSCGGTPGGSVGSATGLGEQELWIQPCPDQGLWIQPCSEQELWIQPCPKQICRSSPAQIRVCGSSPAQSTSVDPALLRADLWIQPCPDQGLWIQPCPEQICGSSPAQIRVCGSSPCRGAFCTTQAPSPKPLHSESSKCRAAQSPL